MNDPLIANLFLLLCAHDPHTREIYILFKFLKSIRLYRRANKLSETRVYSDATAIYFLLQTIIYLLKNFINQPTNVRVRACNML